MTQMVVLSFAAQVFSAETGKEVTIDQMCYAQVKYCINIGDFLGWSRAHHNKVIAAIVEGKLKGVLQ